jgi:hypothetical protein
MHVHMCAHVRAHTHNETAAFLYHTSLINFINNTNNTTLQETNSELFSLNSDSETEGL